MSNIDWPPGVESMIPEEFKLTPEKRVRAQQEQQDQLRALRDFQSSGNMIADYNEFLKIAGQSSRPLSIEERPDYALAAISELKTAKENTLQDPRDQANLSFDLKLILYDLPFAEIDVLKKIIDEAPKSPVPAAESAEQDSALRGLNLRESAKKREARFTPEQVAGQREFAKTETDLSLHHWKNPEEKHNRYLAFRRYVETNGTDRSLLAEADKACEGWDAEEKRLIAAQSEAVRRFEALTTGAEMRDALAQKDFYAGEYLLDLYRKRPEYFRNLYSRDPRALDAFENLMMAERRLRDEILALPVENKGRVN